MKDTIFFVENYGIDHYSAKVICSVIEKIEHLHIVDEYHIWCKYGMLRIYVALWSQNRFHAIVGCDKFYYDVYEMVWVCTGLFYSDNYSDHLKYNHTFSGAKTKKKFKKLMEAFDEN